MAPSLPHHQHHPCPTTGTQPPLLCPLPWSLTFMPDVPAWTLCLPLFSDAALELTPLTPPPPSPRPPRRGTTVASPLLPCHSGPPTAVPHPNPPAAGGRTARMGIWSLQWSADSRDVVAGTSDPGVRVYDMLQVGLGLAPRGRAAMCWAVVAAEGRAAWHAVL